MILLPLSGPLRTVEQNQSINTISKLENKGPTISFYHEYKNLVYQLESSCLKVLVSFNMLPASPTKPQEACLYILGWYKYPGIPVSTIKMQQHEFWLRKVKCPIFRKPIYFFLKHLTHT